MNHLKDALDFAMTHQNVKNAIKRRNDNSFFPIGIHARFLRRDNVDPKKYLVQINFDYYKKDSHVQEDFFVLIEWNGTQYVFRGGDNATELDGHEN